LECSGQLAEPYFYLWMCFALPCEIEFWKIPSIIIFLYFLSPTQLMSYHKKIYLLDIHQTLFSLSFNEEASYQELFVTQFSTFPILNILFIVLLLSSKFVFAKYFSLPMCNLCLDYSDLTIY
jgi:hypothetical protein